jgi:endonuclease YncB( thermonuclease family)
MRHVLLILAFAPMLALGQASAADRIRVVDGNTLEVNGKPLRLAGIDAPELAQTCQQYGNEWPCGEEARNVLERTIGDREVVCLDAGHDAGGRQLGDCRVGVESLALDMLESGMAVATADGSGAYHDAEASARDARRGIWAGLFVRPEAWRQGTRLAPPAVSERCRIKGTLVDGKRLYLVPDSPGYASATVTESKGERWFCSEMEAIQAGWRLPE